MCRTAHYGSSNIVTRDPGRATDRRPGASAATLLTVSVCDEDSEDITLRGAKVLGTCAALSDEILVSTLRPMKAGE